MIVAYYQILEDKKKGETKIDKQFEYNTYIRDFLQTIKEKLQRKQLSVGNTKNNYKDIIVMKEHTSQQLNEAE